MAGRHEAEAAGVIEGKTLAAGSGKDGPSAIDNHREKALLGGGAAGPVPEERAAAINAADNIGMKRDPVKELKLAQEMIKLYDKDPALAKETWKQAYERRSEYSFARVSMGDAQIVYDRVLELSGPNHDTKFGWQQYNKMTGAIDAGGKESFKDAESTKRATEQFVTALSVNDRIAPQMFTAKIAGEGTKMFADMGHTASINKLRALEDAKSVYQVEKESGGTFDQAYNKVKSVNALTDQARDVLKKGGDSGKAIAQAAEILARSLNESRVATNLKLSAGDVPLTETETGSGFYKALKKAGGADKE